MAANGQLLRDGMGVRADGTADRRRTDHRPGRADAPGPDRVGDDRAVDGQGRLGGGPRTRPRRESRRRLSRGPGLPRRAPAATISRRPARSPASGRPRTARPCTGPRSGSWTTLDLDPEGGPPDGPRGARDDRGASAASIARAAGHGDDTAGLPRVRSMTSAGQHPAHEGRAGRAVRPRTSSGRWRSRRASSASCRRAECEVRPVEVEGRPAADRGPVPGPRRSGPTRCRAPRGSPRGSRRGARRGSPGPRDRRRRENHVADAFAVRLRGDLDHNGTIADPIGTWSIRSTWAMVRSATIRGAVSPEAMPSRRSQRWLP